MAIIKKTVSELRPGDRLPANAAYGERIVLCILDSIHGAPYKAVRIWHKQAVDAMSVPLNQELDVEVPDLTPAQQHAEQLAALLDIAAGDDRVLSFGDQHGWPEQARDLLNKLKPEPPTLAEVLASLDALTPNRNGDPEVDIAVRLLDRARRAGLLK